MMLYEDDICKRIQKLSEELGKEYERYLDKGGSDENILNLSRKLDTLIVEHLKKQITISMLE